MQDKAIYIKDLTKNYIGANGENHTALKCLNLEIAKGSIFGLLGPNGAGKSTLINILAGMAVKTSGQVYVMNKSIDEEPKEAKKLIGIVPQEVSYDSFFSLYDGLEFYAGYYGIRPKQRKTEEILKALGLWQKRNNKPQQLSGGMKRRYLIAKAMVHSPKILILDEPTAGVDLELREQLWEYVRKLNKEGVTIIITTHYLAEAQEMCDEIAFIDHGKIIKQDSKYNLLQNVGSRYLDIEFEAAIDGAETQEKCSAKFEMLSDKEIRFYISSEEGQGYNSILKQIRNLGQEVKNIKQSEPDMEKVFRSLIKK